MIRNTREAISHALAFAYEGATQTANYLDYLCPISRSASSQGLQIAMAVQSAKVRAAVNDQPHPISDWLNYCYGPDVEPLNKPLKHINIATTVAKEAFNGHQSHRKAGTLAKIAYIAVQDYRVGQIMGRELPVASYLEATGLHPAHWSRDWEPRRREALMALKRYDIAGIAKVSIVVKAICDAESE
jgi:hypothetical protein